MASAGEPRFGVDLVTFSHPGFWGVGTDAEVADAAMRRPRAFWDRMLDGIEASGVTGVELAFPPFDWHGALAAYGSAERFAAELAHRGLRLSSGFFADPAAVADIADPATQAAMLSEARSYAEFLAACGGDVLVAGLPMRQTPGEVAPRFVDLAYAQMLADLLNRLGAVAAAKGVKLALHTEAHSVFALARDIDLLMLLTDPAYVHFCPDTAHMLLVGGDPLQIVERHHERMVIAHWKDAFGPMPADTPIDARIHERHRPYFCRLGAGRVDWSNWLKLTSDRATSGWAILELDAAPDPVADIAAGLGFVRDALASRGR